MMSSRMVVTSLTQGLHIPLSLSINTHPQNLH